jgi:hypothetical protein
VVVVTDVVVAATVVVVGAPVVEVVDVGTVPGVVELVGAGAVDDASSELHAVTATTTSAPTSARGMTQRTCASVVTFPA